MILHALKEYYDRKAADPESGIAQHGLEWKPLEFLIVITASGEFITIEDLREGSGAKLKGKNFLLPRSIGRSGSKSYETTFLLWDHIGYLLGIPADDPKSSKQHETWIKSLDKLPQQVLDDKSVKAICAFYKKGEIKKALEDEKIPTLLKSIPCNMSFRLDSELIPVACKSTVQKYAKDLMVSKTQETDGDGEYQICLISGEKDYIMRTHSKTPINKDNNSLISFQRNSGYDSYGKTQAYNAPIGQLSEFAYITALNTLLKSNDQRFKLGDTVYICWSEKTTDLESEFAYIFDELKSIDNPDQFTERVMSLYKSVETGAYIDEQGNQKFFVLGLSPGGGTRISVRLWQTGTVAEFAARIKQHFEDLCIVKPPGEPEFYSLWRLLVNIATMDKSENIPPNIAGDFMRSILTGMPYPVSLLQAAVRRIKSDTDKRVKPVRAALIKAYLNRYYRLHTNKGEKEIEMALDVEQPSIGYQLGRLFASLEKVQEEANPKLNATIRERYYSAACSSPVTVFPTLMRLKNHHLAKIESKGRVVNFERLIGEIIGMISDFPAHLDIHEQGKFAIGYYHQRQDFFKKKEEN